MEKLLVTKEQAQALDALKGTWSDKEPNHYYPIIIKEKLRGGWRGYGSYAAAESLSDDDFIKALYFGYEVEKTPEEEIRKYYEESMEFYRESDGGTWGEGYYDGVTDGIVKTLRILGSKIEGVNA